ncbi:hypothetical protein GCM10027449_21120 [Sinomonas notoginsengisoli]
MATRTARIHTRVPVRSLRTAHTVSAKPPKAGTDGSGHCPVACGRELRPGAGPGGGLHARPERAAGTDFRPASNIAAPVARSIMLCSGFTGASRPKPSARVTVPTCKDPGRRTCCKAVRGRSGNR